MREDKNMCLSKLLPDMKVTKDFGWKVFVKNPLTGTICGPYYGKVFNENKWNCDSSNIRISISYSIRYSSGFHVFLTRKAARRLKDAAPLLNLVILKVKFKNIVARGVDCGFKAIVVKDIYLTDVRG